MVKKLNIYNSNSISMVRSSLPLFFKKISGQVLSVNLWVRIVGLVFESFFLLNFKVKKKLIYAASSLVGFRLDYRLFYKKIAKYRAQIEKKKKLKMEKKKKKNKKKKKLTREEYIANQYKTEKKLPVKESTDPLMDADDYFDDVKGLF